jgi:hypothetical protein
LGVAVRALRWGIILFTATASLFASRAAAEWPFPEGVAPTGDKYGHSLLRPNNANTPEQPRNWPELSQCLDRNHDNIRDFYSTPLDAKHTGSSRLEQCKPGKKLTAQWPHSIYIQKSDGKSQTNCQLQMSLFCAEVVSKDKKSSQTVYLMQTIFNYRGQDYGPYFSSWVELSGMRKLLQSTNFSTDLLSPAPSAATPASAPAANTQSQSSQPSGQK